MRNGKRNWLIALLIAGVVVFILGQLSNRPTPTVEAATDTRTAMERYVSAYSMYTQAELERFKEFQSTLMQSDWDAFWSMLVRVTLSTAVILAGWYGFKLSPVIVDSVKKRTSVVRTSTGAVILDYDDNGNIVGRSLEKFSDKPIQPVAGKAMVVGNKGKDSVVIDNDSGKFVDPYDDVADFLEKAVIVSEDDANELPRHDKMGVGGSRWDRMVNDVLKDFFTVQKVGEGVRTYCSSPEYPTLRMMFIATRRHKLPLPQKGGKKESKKP